jgi:hypothetical protein
MLACILVVSIECSRKHISSKTNEREKASYLIVFTANSMVNTFMLVIAYKWRIFIYLLACENLFYFVYLVFSRPYA